MSKMDYDNENVEISSGKSGKIRNSDKMENSKKNIDPTITKGEERNVRCGTMCISSKSLG
jgi:hypothetical protein